MNVFPLLRSGGTGTWTGSCPTATAPRSLGSAIMNDYNLVLPQNDDGLSAALQTQPVFVSFFWVFMSFGCSSLCVYACHPLAFLPLRTPQNGNRL